MTTQVTAFLDNSFLRRFLKKCYRYLSVKFDPLIVAPQYPLGSWFEFTSMYTTWGFFHSSDSFSGIWFSWRKFSQNFLYIFIYRNLTPPVVAPPYPRKLLFEQTNIHYLRMLPCKKQLFWTIRVLTDFFRDTNKFSIILNRLPSEEDLVLHFTKFKSHSLKDALCKVFFFLNRPGF